MTLEDKIKARWNDLNKSKYLDELLERDGYITIGYYKPDTETLGQSMENMPLRIAELGGIASDSRLLDLGCGKGRPCLDIAVKTGCSVVGVDLADNHIELANGYKEQYLVEHPNLKAEFFCSSYFELPMAVTDQSYTHVIMQTSLFYSHHRIDEILSAVSKVLVKGGKMLATDFLRNAPSEEITEFLTFNSMSVMLSMEELKEAFIRHGMLYCEGEDLDESCIKCNTMKRDKAITINVVQLNPDFFKCRKEFVQNKKVTFQLVVAKKL